MSDKILDLGQTVYALCTQDPEIAEILAEAGFRDITRPGMLSTAGRFMTIPKGAAMKRIEIDHIKRIFEAPGYRVVDEGGKS